MAERIVESLQRRRKTARGSNRNAEKSSSSISPSAQNSSNNNSGVIFDVACCDGPVKFHRVLNENYAPSAANQVTISQILSHFCSSILLNFALL